MLLSSETEGNLPGITGKIKKENKTRKQFAYLERKIESFGTHALRKKKQQTKKTKQKQNKAKKQKQKQTKNTKVTKTKRVASREHPSWLLLSFFVNKKRDMYGNIGVLQDRLFLRDMEFLFSC